MITLKQMRYFLVLAEELNFSRAAERLSITQPPLSSSIALLEENLNVRLFERNKRRVVLTPAGKGFMREARHALNQTKRACEVARSLDAGRSGYIDVGITGTMLFKRVPEVVQAFMQANPGVHVTLSEQSTAEQIDALAARRLDVGFVIHSETPDKLTGEPLADEVFVCCLSVRHPWAQRPSISLRELAQESFVMLVREQSPNNYDNVISSCVKAGFYPKIRFSARQWLTVSALVASGLGVALVPSSIAASGIKGACFLPLSDAQITSRTWCLRHQDNHDPVVLSFFDVLLKAMGRQTRCSGV
ncbi:MAG: LysR family transcriptional regulator [Candidimonas sp.]